MTIIAHYKAAPEFTALAQSTRRAYLTYIRLIEDEFGDPRSPGVTSLTNDKAAALSGLFAPNKLPNPTYGPRP